MKLLEIWAAHQQDGRPVSSPGMWSVCIHIARLGLSYGRGGLQVLYTDEHRYVCMKMIPHVPCTLQKVIKDSQSCF